MARVRVRQHVNPLSNVFQVPVLPPDWSQIYKDLSKPLHLDIGCARGRFILSMAEVQPAWNFLGLEIRQPLVEEANNIATEKQLTNLYYFFCNANNYLKTVLQSLPPAMLQRVTIQFPDPWFKNKHQKRRMVQPAMVEELAQFLVPGGELFLQSDVLEVAQEMRERFAAHSAFAFKHDREIWLPENPLPVQTEREIATLRKGEPVYRTLFVRV